MKVSLFITCEKHITFSIKCGTLVEKEILWLDRRRRLLLSGVHLTILGSYILWWFYLWGSCGVFSIYGFPDQKIVFIVSCVWLLYLGDSMKMGNTFWPNLAMKTWYFTHVLDRIPQNAYMPSEFRLTVKKTNCRILCWLHSDIFFKIFRCHLMCEFFHLMNYVTLKI